MRKMWVAAIGLAAVIAALSPSAAFGVPLLVESSVFYIHSGYPYVDGVILNDYAVTTVEDLHVTVDFVDSMDNVLASIVGVESCWVLPPGYRTTFRCIGLTGGFDHYHVWVDGTPTSRTRVNLDSQLVASGADLDGHRWWTYRLTNNNAFTVAGLWTAAWEVFTPAGGSPAFWDAALEPPGGRQSRLAPGEWLEIMVWGQRPSGAGVFAAACPAEALRAAPTDTVWRFYNKRTGTHLYTADAAERDNIIGKLSWLYNYEGPAYNAYATPQPGTVPLVRFYNKRSGTHFYSADTAEIGDVIAKLSWLYNYEGICYFIAEGGGQSTNTVWRFFNKREGVHFYTIDVSERNDVLARLSWLYSYEGPAFTVPKYTP